MTAALLAALTSALLLFDPLTPAFAAPKAGALLLIAALALPWMPRPGWIWWSAVGVLLLVTGLALDPALALWGRPPRAEGALLLLAILVFGALAGSLPTDHCRRLDRVLHLAGTLVALSVLAGVFRLSIPGLPAGFADGHGGTLGNPNTAGAVLAALLVHAAARGGDWRWLMPLYAAALFGTGSRAAWLATLLGWAWLLPPGLLRRLAIGALLSGALALFATLALRAEPSASAALRLELWGSALRALQPVPRQDDALGPVRWLIGYGPEQQAEALERHRRPEQNRWEQGGEERVADRAHNLVLDGWLSFGLAGLAAFAWMLRRIRRASDDSRPEAAAALALISAGLLGFFGPAEWLLLALWLARCGNSPADPPRAGPSLTRALAGIALALLSGFALWRGTPPQQHQQQRETMESTYRRLLIGPRSPEAWQDLAQRSCARAQIRTQDGEAQLLCAQSALAAGDRVLALSAAERATRLRPARPRAWLLRVLAGPRDAASAIPALALTLRYSTLDPTTRAAFRRALMEAALQEPGLTALPDWADLMRGLEEPSERAAALSRLPQASP